MGLEMVGGGDVGGVVAWTLVGETERTKSANNTSVLADAALLMLFNRFTNSPEFYRCFFSGSPGTNSGIASSHYLYTSLTCSQNSKNRTASDTRRRNFYTLHFDPRTGDVSLFIFERLEPPIYQRISVGVFSPNPDCFVVVG